MKQKLFIVLPLLALMIAPGRLLGQAGPAITAVQLTQRATTINLQSQRGVPISTTVNPTIGSDGQEPTVDSSNLGNTPTTNQFASLITFGAVTATTNNALLTTNNPYLQGTNAFSLAVANNMQLPVGISGNTVLVLRRAWVGAPYVAQTINFYFGSVITPPASDYQGIVLTNASPSSYWLAQPYPAGNYNGTNYATSSFYYSPNAGEVFATRAGPISITWITAARYSIGNLPPYTNRLATTGFPSYITNTDNSISLLYTVNYLVSPSPVKPPQKMYWTEGAFANFGYVIPVPPGRLSAMNVIYNSSFPASVSTPYPDPGSTNALPTQTLWYQQGAFNAGGTIHAYNAQGRVFVELLGPLMGTARANSSALRLWMFHKRRSPWS
jgi:hypothetical protein